MEIINLYQSHVKNFLQKERAYKISPDIFSKQNDININMYKILIDWLFNLADFKTNSFLVTYYIIFRSEYIILRYLECHDVNRSQLQLIGATALWISYKMESRELYPFDTNFLVCVCADIYTQKEFTDMEISILLSVHPLNYTNPLDFLDIEEDEITNYILSVQLYFADPQTLDILPSLLFIAASELSAEIRDVPSPISDTYGYTFGQIQNAKTVLKQNLQKITSQNSVFKYFDKNKFNQTSTYVCNNINSSYSSFINNLVTTIKNYIGFHV